MYYFGVALLKFTLSAILVSSSNVFRSSDRTVKLTDVHITSTQNCELLLFNEFTG